MKEQSLTLHITEDHQKSFIILFANLHEKNTTPEAWMFIKHFKNKLFDNKGNLTIELKPNKRHPELAREAKRFLALLLTKHQIPYAITYTGQPVEEIPPVFKVN